MRTTTLLLVALPLLAGCTEVLRKPNFHIDNIESVQGSFEYQVTGYDITPEIVSRANSSPFVRFVNIGGGGVGPVRRLPESALFSGPKPPANKRPEYIIGVGDRISVSRSGYDVNANGIQTRQASANTYVVSERGTIDLLEGRSVLVEGLTIADASAAVSAALQTTTSVSENSFQEREFPISEPPTYRLGAGDVIRVSRLRESTNDDGAITQRVETTQNIVGPNGVVSILQLGELEAAGLTLPEMRDQVLQEAIRNSAGLDTVVEMASFGSQSVLVSGDLGTRVVQITDQPLTYDRLISQLNPSFAGNRDYLVTLERDGQEFQMSAKSIVLDRPRDQYYAFDGDRIRISELLPSSDVQVNVTDFGARNLTYLRVSEQAGQTVSRGQTVPFDLRGIDLRRLLISQGIDVGQNEDLLIRLNRAGTTYNLSAQSAVLENPSRRYWLAPDDHVVAEDIAYVGNNALIVGELLAPQQLPINHHSRTTLSEALFASGVFGAPDADFRHVYVFRGESLTFDAFHFDITQVLNLSLAEDFELRPGDILFVRTRPLTRYNRALTLALTFLGLADRAVVEPRTFGE